MNDRRPAFLITIDAEGDNLWEPSEIITTQNSHYLPRFQNLCEQYGFKPTYLTNYEMAQDSFFCEFTGDVLKRGSAEIGMHLHAWNSPPLIDCNLKGQPYLIEYPENVMKQKIEFMTELLKKKFDRKPTSHRSGRWAFNSTYARLLVENGYQVDCSVTPHVSWTHVPGDPNGSGGTDYSHYPATPYFMDLDQLHQRGHSTLLEVPVTILKKSSQPLVTHWLRPNGSNRKAMLAILKQASDEQWPDVEFMLHSSELMPAGSPTFRTEQDIEMLYADLETLFSAASNDFQGMTLNEFYVQFESH